MARFANPSERLNEKCLRCDSSAASPPATLLIGGKPIDTVRQAAIAGFTD